MQMEPREQWIWLSEKSHPHHQTTRYDALSASDRSENYTVAAFSRRYHFKSPVKNARLRFSGDTAFVLRCNGTVIARGPACVGGDFLGNGVPRPQYYATELDLSPELLGDTLSLEATVRMSPVQICDFSMGHGGFFLDGELELSDGTLTFIGTDESWEARRLSAYCARSTYDDTQPPCPAEPAAPVQNVWHTLTSPLPPCTLSTLYPEDNTLTLAPGETVTRTMLFDRIYAGYLSVQVCTSGPLQMTLTSFETDEQGPTETFRFTRDTQYEGMILYSVGGYTVTVTNQGTEPAKAEFALITSCFPVTEQAGTTTSDPELNKVLDVCAHTLRYCRQTHHLDSPKHCEPMACTGDYYIEMLMTACTFGDQRLSLFDIRRTAQLLRYHNGRMFHTTYSLIWVRMLRDAWMLTGDETLLTDCRQALIPLLERFETYMGDNGLVETPPDYMFIDWLFPDGISTHHPPKALGQTCLNLFLFGALGDAAQLFDRMSLAAMAARCREKAAALKTAILQHLYDPDRGLFFEGLNTPTPEHLLGQYMPQNVEKRYYRPHANILAAYFGLLDKADCAALLERVAADDSLGPVQPYFMHFWLEAIRLNGLRETFTLPLLELWKAPVRECPKGLAEGFYRPEPTYQFDHSHAWGGTPAWSLPAALTGLELLEPGWKTIRLAPSLLGLDFARVEIPTPYGMLRVEMEQNSEPRIFVPEGIRVVPESSL